MALAGKHDQKNYRVFVLLGDGECDEGSVWEATMSASHFKLDNLITIVDFNKLQAALVAKSASTGSAGESTFMLGSARMILISSMA
ncbi:transketolase, partial [Candidatus Hakubella thermalkaliphila]